MRPRHYRRYTTGLKQQYCAGILPAHVTSCIPRSTKYYWIKISGNDHSMPAGYTESQQTIAPELLFLRNENTALKIRLKALLYLLAIYKTILQQFTIRKQHLGGIYQPLTRALQYTSVHLPQYNPWQQLPFSYKQWLAYTGKPLCSLSAIALCRRQHPSQLSLQEQRHIASGCAEQRFANWSLASVYYQLLREQKVHCSLSTFYKYCRLMNIATVRVKKPVKRTSLKAADPLKMLHMDITLFTTANGMRHYIYVIIDNYSRALLAARVAVEYSSRIARETLEEVLIKYGLIEQEGVLITDGGPENKGAVTEWLSKPGMLWQKLMAQVDIIQSNSMVDAANKIIKYTYLFPAHISDTAALIHTTTMMLQSKNNVPITVSITWRYT